MQQRISIVDKLNILSVIFSSVLEIGDSNSILPYSRALAVQREHEIFYGGEGNFDNPIFYEPVPRPVINERITFTKINESPHIHVHSVTIFGISTSSIAHIGSTNLIQGEARVKHVRHLKDGGKDPDETIEN